MAFNTSGWVVVDRSNSTELSRAINSMSRWYRDVARCYAYLSDGSASGILKCRDKPPVNGTAQNDSADAREGALWVHRRVASMQSSIIRVALLSVFPFPESTLGVENLHFRFLLILAETLDILLLNSLRIKDSENATATYRLCFGTKPRATGPTPMENSKSPEEIGVFVDIVQQHESQVWSHTSKSTRWHLLSKLLQVQNVVKSAAQIKTSYETLPLVSRSEGVNGAFPGTSSSPSRTTWCRINLFNSQRMKMTCYIISRPWRTVNWRFARMLRRQSRFLAPIHCALSPATSPEPPS
ncbi:hypothetical protein F5Y03DRAFT_411068 [Xylaria venustula]|nr:hypothetical protein F5Y03DRAFT_411068 [Xylaria venustula]